MADTIPLGDVHRALSQLLDAVQTEFPFAHITLTYDGYVYLQVKVETTIEKRQLVVDRLHHGVLNGDYDYRFTSVCHTPSSEEYWQVITACPELYPRRKST